MDDVGSKELYHVEGLAGDEASQLEAYVGLIHVLLPLLTMVDDPLWEEGSIGEEG